MDIYSILSSKPHNSHYLKRYIRFIESCESPESDYERHHICPKAKDMFPEYASFRKNPWNMKILSVRQHFIAHWMLWKAYGGSQTSAFWRMCNGSLSNKDSAHYSELRKKHKKITQAYIAKLVEKGEWHTQSKQFSDFMSDVQRSRVEDGTHHWLTEKHRANRSKLMSKDTGLNPFQNVEFIERNAEKSRDRQRAKAANGTHTFMSEKFKNEQSIRTSMSNTKRGSRENVKRLKSIISERKISLGRGWNNRSDDWIDSKILELSL